MKKLFKATLIIGSATLLTVASAVNFTCAAPTINLFPKDIAEQLKNTGDTAKVMEHSLKDVIARLEVQRKLNESTGCDGSSIDPGCLEIRQQMSDTYMDLLGVMKANLPEMKSSISATNRGIKKSIRRQLGKKVSPAGIQKLLAKQKTPKVVNGRYSLSKRFNQYRKIISSGNNQTMAVLAAEVFLDTKAVIQMIDSMELDIIRQETLHKLGSSYGTLNDSMYATVDAVKTMIFGEPEDGDVLPEARGGDVGSFHSPLEMD